MKIIADTHIAIWVMLAPEKLSRHAASTFTKAERRGSLMLADITLWEIAMLIKKKRIHIGIDTQLFLDEMLAAYNFSIIGINNAIAAQAVSLPMSINNDPADRIIAATSLIYGAVLITADENLRAAPMLTTIW
jgi:PIN domain nuclease of toxin-antitoxin system